jgi:hypothetical protein
VAEPRAQMTSMMRCSALVRVEGLFFGMARYLLRF